MCKLLNKARRMLVGRSMIPCLVIHKWVLIIDIGRLRDKEISHKEMKTQREKPYGS